MPGTLIVAGGGEVSCLPLLLLKLVHLRVGLADADL